MLGYRDKEVPAFCDLFIAHSAESKNFMFFLLLRETFDTCNWPKLSLFSAGWRESDMIMKMSKFSSKFSLKIELRGFESL